MTLAAADLTVLPVLARLPGTVDLFAFSASIGMAHRIHFDADYSRDVEGHPALVVQGPLQAAYIVQMVQRWASGLGATASLVAFRYRHRRPVYVDQELLMGGEVVSFDEATQRALVSVWVRVAGNDAPATTGDATFTLRAPGREQR